MGDNRLNVLNPARRGSSYSPFFIYALIAISLVYGGTTPFATFFIRAVIISLCAIMFLKDGVSYPVEISLPLMAFFSLSMISCVLSFRASAFWPSAQWSLNILTLFLFFFLVFPVAREHRTPYFSYLRFLGALVTIQLFVQLLQRYGFSNPRPSGTFFNPNFLGGFYAMSGSLFLGALLYRGKHLFGRSPLLLVSFLVSLTGILLTGSRGAALSFVAGISVVTMFRFRLKAAVIVAGIAVIMLTVPNPIKERIFSSADIYRYSRAHIYSSALRIFGDHPGGIGLGNLKYYFPAYNFPIYDAVALFGKKARTVHNEHLQVLVELGLAGTLAYMCFLISLGIRVLFWGEGNSPWVRAGVTGALLTLLVHGCVDSVYHTFALPLNAVLLVCYFAAEQNFEWRRVGPGMFLKVGTLFGCVLLLVVSISTVSGYYLARSGKKLLEKEKYQEASVMLKRSTRVDPLNANYRESLAAANLKAYLTGGGERFYRDSLNSLDGAIRLYSRSEELYDRRGFVLTKGVKGGVIGGEEIGWALDEAIGSYEKVLALNPYNVFAMKNLSLLLLKGKDVRGAEVYMRRAVSTEPNYAYGHFLLGKIREEEGDNEAAAFLYKRAMAIYKRYSGEGGLEKYAGMLVTLDEDTRMEIKEKTE